MAFFQWKSEYDTNIATIDQQHKRLVELLNKLYEAMQNGQGRETSGKVLDELVSYTRQHFSTEERLMRAAAYPGSQAHEQQHTQLTAQVVAYMQDFQSGKLNLTLNLSSFLKDWLTSHILETDKKYAPHLISKGIR